MEMFEKVSKVAKNVGSSIYNTTKEQSELAGLNIQLSTLEKKLDNYYSEIGKKYVEYVTKCDVDSSFMVDDILEQIQPELDKRAELKLQIEEKEREIKVKTEEKQKKKAQDEFDTAKKRLDKALEIDIITQEEYSDKLMKAQKKLDNYEILRKVDMQLSMGIITREEYEEKKKDILG